MENMIYFLVSFIVLIKKKFLICTSMKLTPILIQLNSNNVKRLQILFKHFLYLIKLREGGELGLRCIMIINYVLFKSSNILNYFACEFKMMNWILYEKCNNSFKNYCLNNSLSNWMISEFGQLQRNSWHVILLINSNFVLRIQK